MKRIASVVLCLASAALIAPAAVSAQMNQQPQTITFATGLQRAWATVKQNMMEAAEKMPEENYMFEPNPEIRNFGELFGHTANAQFNNCAVASGQANPNQGKDQELLNKSKAEYIAALKASIDFCDPVYAALTDATAMEMIKQGNNTAARGWVLANNVIHSNEMYGTTSVYMRLKNLVPPSTERQTRSRR
jgi:hypothetical protein